MVVDQAKKSRQCKDYDIPIDKSNRTLGIANEFPNPASASQKKKGTEGEATIQEKPKSTEPKDNAPKQKANEILANPKSTFQERLTAVQSYLDVLAKPVGSLGTLEAWAARLAALHRSLSPNVDRVACLIFAGDHGVAAPKAQGGEECSAYPQAVTKSVLLGLHREVAGASVLAKGNNVDLRVVDVGVILGDDQGPFENSSVVKVSSRKLLHGTQNFCVEPAMSEAECERCMIVGRKSLNEFVEETSAKAVVLGEIGIGNTTSSSALIAIMTSKSAREVCGGGAFVTKEASQEVILKKIDVVERALSRHFGANASRQVNVQGLEALAKLGGAEIASLVGAFLEASTREIPVLVDGFIATAAALVAVAISPNVCNVLFFTSQSAEIGQRAALEKIQEIAMANGLPIDNIPALSMGLRMGEGTAALLAVPILRSSANVLSDMATIQDILS
ncbi:unnamed protein product [Cylindrotheca closterium]|uniref:Nicotinate-nucleotide--dimethylbenzimidazole phosphoribosyltransferase n=1 Tax=Cylindrotheca closterium TaxID=2856 RepID=A0AAD2FZ02_9STRA|nr:unnamed protein product [Cylindrotheca closterium]